MAATPGLLVSDSCNPAPLIRWCNETLKARSMSIRDLSDLGTDGLSLVNLVEVLSGKLIKHNKTPSVFAKSDNIQSALKFLAADNVQINNVISTDITKGDRKPIMVVVRALVFRYQIGAQVESRHGRRASAMSLSSSTLTVGSSSLTVEPPRRSLSPIPGASARPETPATQEPPNLLFRAKSLLLQWAQLRLPQLGIRNFTTDWTTGRALAGLVDFLCPGSFPGYSELDARDSLTHLRAAIDAAYEHLQIPKIIEPEEFAQADEVCVMCYISYFRNIEIKRAGIIISSTSPSLSDSQIEIPIVDVPEPRSTASNWETLQSHSKGVSLQVGITRQLQLKRKQEVDEALNRLKASEQSYAQLMGEGVGDPVTTNQMDSVQRAAKLEELKKVITTIRGELVVLGATPAQQNWKAAFKEASQEHTFKSLTPPTITLQTSQEHTPKSLSPSITLQTLRELEVKREEIQKEREFRQAEEVKLKEEESRYKREEEAPLKTSELISDQPQTDTASSSQSLSLSQEKVGQTSEEEGSKRSKREEALLEKLKRLKRRKAEEQRVNDALRENQLQQLIDLKQEVSIVQKQLELVTKEKDVLNEQAKRLQYEREQHYSQLLQATQQVKTTLKESDSLRELLTQMDAKYKNTSEEKLKLEQDLSELQDKLEKKTQLVMTREGELVEAENSLTKLREEGQQLSREILHKEEDCIRRCDALQNQLQDKAIEKENLKKQLRETEQMNLEQQAKLSSQEITIQLEAEKYNQMSLSFIQAQKNLEQLQSRQTENTEGRLQDEARKLVEAKEIELQLNKQLEIQMEAANQLKRDADNLAGELTQLAQKLSVTEGELTKEREAHGQLQTTHENLILNTHDLTKQLDTATATVSKLKEDLQISISTCEHKSQQVSELTSNLQDSIKCSNEMKIEHQRQIEEQAYKMRGLEDSLANLRETAHTELTALESKKEQLLTEVNLRMKQLQELLGAKEEELRETTNSRLLAEEQLKLSKEEYATNLAQKQTQLDQKDEELLKLTAVVQLNENKLAKLFQSSVSMEALLKETREQLQLKEQELTHLKEEFDEVTKANSATTSALRQDVCNREGEIKRIESELHDALDKKCKLQEQLTAAQGQVEVATNQIQQLRGELSQKEAALQELQKEMEQTISSMSAQRTTDMEQLEAEKCSSAQLKSELDEIKAADLEGAMRKLHETEQLLDTEKKSTNQLTGEKEELLSQMSLRETTFNEEWNSSEKKLTDVHTELTRQMQANDLITEDLKALRGQLEAQIKDNLLTKTQNADLELSLKKQSTTISELENTKNRMQEIITLTFEKESNFQLKQNLLDLEKSHQEFMEKASQEHTELQKSNEEHHSQEQRMWGERELLAKEKKDVESNLAAALLSASEIQKDLDREREALGQLTTERNSLHARTVSLEEQLSREKNLCEDKLLEVKEQRESLEKHLHQLETQLKEKDDVIQAEKENSTKIMNECSSSNKKAAELQNQLCALLEEAEKQKGASIAQIHQIEQEKMDIEAQQQHTDFALREALGKLDKVASEANLLRVQVSQRDEEISQLKDEIEKESKRFYQELKDFEDEKIKRERETTELLNKLSSENAKLTEELTIKSARILQVECLLQQARERSDQEAKETMKVKESLISSELRVHAMQEALDKQATEVQHLNEELHQEKELHAAEVKKVEEQSLISLLSFEEERHKLNEKLNSATQEMLEKHKKLTDAENKTVALVTQIQEETEIFSHQRNLLDQKRQEAEDNYNNSKKLWEEQRQQLLAQVSKLEEQVENSGKALQDESECHQRLTCQLKESLEDNKALQSQMTCMQEKTVEALEENRKATDAGKLLEEQLSEDKDLIGHQKKSLQELAYLITELTAELNVETLRKNELQKSLNNLAVELISSKQETSSLRQHQMQMDIVNANAVGEMETTKSSLMVELEKRQQSESEVSKTCGLLRDELEATKADLARERTNFAELQQLCKDAEERNDSVSSMQYQNKVLQDSLGKRDQLISQNESHIAQSEAEKIELEKEKLKALQDIEVLEGKLKAFETQMENTREENEKIKEHLTSELRNSATKTDSLTEQLSTESSRVRELEGEKKRLSQLMEQTQADCNAAIARNRITEESLAAEQRKTSELQDTLVEAEDTMQHLESVISEAKQQVSKLQDEKDEAVKLAESLRPQMPRHLLHVTEESKQKRFEALATQIKALEEEREKATTQVTILETQVSQLQQLLEKEKEKLINHKCTTPETTSTSTCTSTSTTTATVTKEQSSITSPNTRRATALGTIVHGSVLILPWLGLIVLLAWLYLVKHL
ncbi:hypothetical protein Pelo_6433 [Pelomyxa schiedti]|nr:hypothetical protein Pelo_6433 [Pelomyxa schiedti]